MLERTLLAAWNHRGGLALALWPLSLIYRALWHIRRLAYRLGWLRTQRVAVPVVIVGNVVAGGAGKTPLVLALVQALQSHGWQPGIISRGYKGRSKDTSVEVHNTSAPDDVGDEPLLLRRRSGRPVFVGRSRVQAAQALLRAYPEVDVLLSDDGLQHLALERDVEVCVFDARGTGNGWLLPAGPLREPWPRRADVVVAPSSVALGCPVHEVPRQLAPVAHRADGSTVALEALRGQRLIALAAIALPERFFGMLRQAGLTPERCLSLPDHFDFAADPAGMDPEAQLLCTEKDAVKLWRRHPQAWAVALQVDLPLALVQTVLDKLARARATQL